MFGSDAQRAMTSVRRVFGGQFRCQGAPQGGIARLVQRQRAGQLEDHAFGELRRGIALQPPPHVGCPLNDADELVRRPRAQFAAVEGAQRDGAIRALFDGLAPRARSGPR